MIPDWNISVNHNEKKIRKRLEKRRRKDARFDGLGQTSRYALKRSGQIPVTPRLRPVWCGTCYHKVAMCQCYAQPAE